MGRAGGARHSLLVRMPAGYGLALAGGVLFFVGGGADLLWHTVFGIEFGIDALLSPPHLWLFVAGALLLSGPRWPAAPPVHHPPGRAWPPERARWPRWPAWPGSSSGSCRRTSPTPRPGRCRISPRAPRSTPRWRSRRRGGWPATWSPRWCWRCRWPG